MAIAAKSKAQAAPTARASRAAKPAPAATQVAGVTFVSLNPKTFTQGGLIDDIDVEITDALAVMWDYNGQAAEGPALAVEYTDNNGAQHLQYYSAGKAEDWAVHESGEGFISKSGKTGFNNNSNIAMLFASLLECGFPEENLTGNVKVLIGVKGHVNQHVTERKGLIRTGKNADRPSQVLLFTKVTELPGGESTGQTKAAAPAASTAAGGRPNGAATVGADDVDSELQGYLLAALAETPVIEKKNIVKIVFQQATEAKKTTKERNAMVVRVGQPDFLKGLEGAGISYTGTEISMAE